MAINTSYRYTGIALVRKTLQVIKLFLITVFLGRLERYGISSKIFLQATPPKTYADPVVDFRERIFLFLLKRRIREVAFLFYGAVIAVFCIALFSQSIAVTAAIASKNLRGSGVEFIETAANKLYTFSQKTISAEVADSYRPKALEMSEKSFYPMVFEDKKAFFIFARSLVWHGKYALRETDLISYYSAGKITTASEMNKRVNRWQAATDEFLSTGYFPPFQEDEIEFAVAVAKSNLENAIEYEGIKYSLPNPVLEKATADKTRSFIANLSKFEGNVAKALDETKGE